MKGKGFGAKASIYFRKRSVIQSGFDDFQDELYIYKLNSILIIEGYTLSRRVAHRENALFALVRDIRGDIHQKYNAQYRGDIHEYRGDIHEYRAISRNIAISHER